MEKAAFILSIFLKVPQWLSAHSNAIPHSPRGHGPTIPHPRPHLRPNRPSNLSRPTQNLSSSPPVPPDYVQELRPQIFVTYNGDNFDWPFVEKRARMYKVSRHDEVNI